jgi:hypothetical protein
MQPRVSGNSGLLLVPAATLIVHQARYTLAYGSGASSQLAIQGHSYLQSLVPWALLALGIGLSAFLRRAAVAFKRGDSGRSTRSSTPLLWLGTTGGLVGLYALQELLEAFLAVGHPAGLAGVFGHGGWWSVPAAAVVAAGVVALLRAGGVLLRIAARAGSRSSRRTGVELPAPHPVALVRTAPLARAAAGRAPPALLPA